MEPDAQPAASRPREREPIYAVTEEAAFLEADDHDKREPAPPPPPEGVTFFPCSFCRNTPRHVVLSDYPVRDHQTLAIVGQASICYDCAIRAAESLTMRPVPDATRR